MTAVVKNFLKKSYYLGYLQLNFNGAFKLNKMIVKDKQRQKHSVEPTENMKDTVAVCAARNNTKKVLKKSQKQMIKKKMEMNKEI